MNSSYHHDGGARRRATRCLTLAALLAAGCAQQSTLTSVQTTGEAIGGSERSLTLAPPPALMLLDCQPRLLGVTVRFPRVPTVSELNELALQQSLERVVLDLPGWPQGFAELQALEQAPRSVELVAVLPGYPPGPSQADAWNQLRARVRIMVVARGVPGDRTVVQALNTLRGLERVVVWTDDPSGVRIERLAAPLSFQVQR